MGADPTGSNQPQLALDPLAEAVSAARRYVSAALRGLGRADLEEAATLATSELVTNATVHARTRIVVSVELTPEGRVRVGVRDYSPGVPRQRQYGLDATTGRGLRIVESMSSDWGVVEVNDATGSGKIVWFEPTAEIEGSAFAETEWLAGL